MTLYRTQDPVSEADAPGTSWELLGATSRGGPQITTSIPRFPFRIGRNSENDLCLPSVLVSGRHAELMQLSGLLFVRDHGSTNGTCVNGTRITHDTVLSEGDLIEIGEMVLRVQVRPEFREPRPNAGLSGKTVNFHDRPEFKAPLNLQKVLRDGNLLPCFQSIHCLRTGIVRGYEYLARCPYSGIQTANQLFEQARYAGREAELSLLCRERAMAFTGMLSSDIPIFLNTHPAESLTETTVPQLRQLRAAYPTRPIVLEIHEASVTDPGLIRSVRQSLAEIDVQLAFDDFGCGQARFRELITVSADYVKFDASLIHDLVDVPDDQLHFLRAIIDGVRSKGAITVAEGVETVQVADACRRIGFDLVQGYLFNKPTIMARDDASIAEMARF